MKKVEIENLTFSYDTGVQILKGLNLSIEEGECVGLIGANGAGKSTLLKLMVGLLDCYEGKLLMSNLPADKKNMPEIRKKVGYLFQDSENQLFLSTVYEDVAFGPRNYGFSVEETEEKVNKALEMVEMTELRDRPVYKLSGGQKKLAAIATLLSMEPDMILFDEPSVALDPRNRRNLIRIVKSLPSTKLIASHDIDMIEKLCDRTILMSDGMIVYDGDTKTLLQNEEMLLQYGL